MDRSLLVKGLALVFSSLQCVLSLAYALAGSYCALADGGSIERCDSVNERVPYLAGTVLCLVYLLNAACCVAILGLSRRQGMPMEGLWTHLRRVITPKRFPYEATLLIYTIGILVQSCVMLGDEEADWVYMACEILSVTVTSVTTSLIADQDVSPRTLWEARQIQREQGGYYQALDAVEDEPRRRPISGGEDREKFSFMQWTCFTCYVHNYSLFWYDLAALCSRLFSYSHRFGPGSYKPATYVFLNVCAIAYRKLQADFYYAKMQHPSRNPFLPKLLPCTQHGAGVAQPL